MSVEPGETYLHDGLYASFDGWQFRLRAPRENGDHVVFLDDRTLIEFERFVERIKREIVEKIARDDPP